MNCYCYPQQCMGISYGSDCCVTQQQHQQQRKKMTMLERQGIWMRVNPTTTPPSVTNYRPKISSPNTKPPPFEYPRVPSLRITKDTDGPFLSSHSNLENLHDGKIVRDTLWMTESKYYDENRGPILRIKGRKVEAILTYKEFLKLDEDGDPIEANMEDYSEFYPEVEDLFVYDEMEPFSTTTRCKQVKFITIVNEGTVAIRYQWLRAPPTRALRKILGRPGSILNLKKLRPPKDDPFFWKDTCFEFHFRELPGVILPGQAVRFPVIFRPRRTGYFYEKIYLMTHPRLSDVDDKIFHVQLGGICMEPDCPLPHSKSSMFGKKVPVSFETISKQIKGKMLYQEAMDILNAILDTVLYDLKLQNKSTLPFGKITVEKIFYTHNPGLYYHYNVAEKALEDVRSLVTLLVPKDRIIGNEKFCPLSIKSLYFELAKSPPQTEYFINNLKSPEAEEKLKELAESNRVLVKPRVFSWPTKGTRIHSSCYTTMVALMVEVVARIENVDFDANNPDLDKVLRAEIKDKLIKKKKKEAKRRLRHAKKISNSNSPQHPSPYGEDDAEEEDEGGDILTTMLDKGIDDDNPQTSTSKTTRQTTKTDKSSSRSKDFGLTPVLDDGDTLELESQLGEYLEDEEEEGEGNDVKYFEGMQYDISEEEIVTELQELKGRKEKQGKRVLFETLFGCGVERMMSVVDSFRHMYDYTGSNVIRKPDPAICSKH